MPIMAWPSQIAWEMTFMGRVVRMLWFIRHILLSCSGMALTGRVKVL
jgi:hypothetical protein